MTFMANGKQLVDVCRFEFLHFSFAYTRTLTLAFYSWTGLFSETLQPPPVRFCEVPRYNFFAKCNVLIHFWPAKSSYYIKSYGFYKLKTKKQQQLKIVTHFKNEASPKLIAVFCIFPNNSSVKSIRDNCFT